MARPKITGIILAGGKSSRMGGKDKGLLMLNGKPLYQHVIDRINPQVDDIMINCNRHLEHYALSGYPIFCDDFDNYCGPLSGMYSGLRRSTTAWNLIVSCDTPFLPCDLVRRLWTFTPHYPAVYVATKEQAHPTLLLIHSSMTQQIHSYLTKGERKLILFLSSINAQAVDFSDTSHALININTPAELTKWTVS